MLETVRPALPFLSKPDTFLLSGCEYEAESNLHGAICGVCENGERLGVKPGEFVFVSAPEWVVHIWESKYPSACYGCQIISSKKSKTETAKKP